jgi:hypothetical protein
VACCCYIEESYWRGEVTTLRIYVGYGVMLTDDPKMSKELGRAGLGITLDYTRSGKNCCQHCVWSMTCLV